MKIKNISVINPNNDKSINELNYINYLDTASVNNGKITNFTLLNNGQYPSRAKKILMQNDIIISSVDPRNHNCIIKKSVNNLIGSSAFHQIRIKPNTHWLIKYIYYFLISNKNLIFFENNSTGTILPTFNKKIIENLDLPEISYSKQQHIVNTIIHVFLFLKFL